MQVEGGKNMLESMSVTGSPTQKLVGVVREKYIQYWQNKTNRPIRQVTPSITHSLSCVVVTSNEQENIKPLLASLQEIFGDVCVEVIIVGDGSNTTIKEAAMTMNSERFQIRVEQYQAGNARSQGLGTAIVDGLYKAKAEHIMVIPASLQLHVMYLRMLYDQAIAQNLDLVVASLAGKRKKRSVAYRGIPVYLRWLARRLFARQLRDISNPWSNLFLLRRELLADVTLRPASQNILLELLIRCKWYQMLEMTYTMQTNRLSRALIGISGQTWRHMLRLWSEVPDVGRVWKISFLVIMNFALVFALLMIDRSFPWLLSDLGILVFAVIAGLDFVIFNRFIFPSPIVRDAASSLSVTENETIEALTEESGSVRVEPKRKWRTVRKISNRFLSLVTAALIVVAIGWIGYTRPGALLVVAVLFIGSAIVFAKGVKSAQAITMLLAISTGVATIDYVSWRFIVTNWQAWWIAGPLLFAETLGRSTGWVFNLQSGPGRHPSY